LQSHSQNIANTFELTPVALLLGFEQPKLYERLSVSAAERRTPNAERRTLNAERRTPNAKRQTPNAKRPHHDLVH
jgi:hypothetical protein